MKTSLAYKLLSLTLGAIFFLVILPFSFFVVGTQINLYLGFKFPKFLEILITVTTIPFGLFFLLWATYTQWQIGKGTPAPNAPTQRLIIVGPYSLCRNPIEFGAIFYYLGIGTLFGNLTIGFTCGTMGFIFGTLYHKLVEERELALRFGQDYISYKHKVPFILPCIWRSNRSDYDT